MTYLTAMNVFLSLLTLSLPILGALPSETLKEVLYQKQIELEHVSSEGEKSQIFYTLALTYCQDQEVDKAFLHFLEALKNCSLKEPVAMKEEEAALYEQALSIYQKGIQEPVHMAQELLAIYGSVAEDHPDWVQLNFLMAAAYGNLGKYDLFFDRFFRGYPYFHDSFLAYKTRGILYLRLAQRSKSFEEKRPFLQEAHGCLNLALERNPQDASLYKILISLSRDEQDEVQILSYLQQLVREKVAFGRGDIYLYVREAVSLEEYELGQALVDQAKALFEFSRSVVAAQEYLNESRG